MAYLGIVRTGSEAIRANLESAIGWPKFEEAVIERAEKLEYSHSSFSDPGDDWNECRLFDAEGVEIACTRQEGF